MSRKITPAKKVKICDYCGEIILPTQHSYHGAYGGWKDEDFHATCYDMFIEERTRKAVERIIKKGGSNMGAT